MRLISDMLRFFPAWKLSEIFNVSSSTVRRIDFEVLKAKLSPVGLVRLKAICFDRFHVVGNLNDALDLVRMEEVSKASEMQYRLISNSRYLLLRGKENTPVLNDKKE